MYKYSVLAPPVPTLLTLFWSPYVHMHCTFSHAVILMTTTKMNTEAKISKLIPVGQSGSKTL